MINDGPTYIVRHAFESAAVVTCFGFDGLRETVPRLETGLYIILEGRDEVGVAERHPRGNWAVIMNDGTRAGPGFIIV